MESPDHNRRQNKPMELRLLYAGKYLDPNGQVHDIWFGFVLHRHRSGKLWYTLKYSAAKNNVPLGNRNVGQVKRNLITFDHHWVEHWRCHLTENGQWNFGHATLGRSVQREYLLKCWLDNRFVDPHPDGNPRLNMGAQLNVIHQPGGVMVDPLKKRLRQAAASKCYPNSRILLSPRNIRIGIWSAWAGTALHVIRDFLGGNMAADRAGQVHFDVLQTDRIEAAFWELGWRVDWRAVRKANKHVRNSHVRLAINSRSWKRHQPIMVDEHQQNSRNVKTIMDSIRKGNPENHDYDTDEESSDDESDPFRSDSESSDSGSSSNKSDSDSNNKKRRTKSQPYYRRYYGPTIGSHNSQWAEGEDEDEFMDAEKTPKAYVIPDDTDEEAQSEDDLDDMPAILGDSSSLTRSLSPMMERGRGRTPRRPYEIESDYSDAGDSLFVGTPPPANPNMSRSKEMYHAGNQTGQSLFGNSSSSTLSNSSYQSIYPHDRSPNTPEDTPIDRIPPRPSAYTPDDIKGALRTINEVRIRELAERAARQRSAMQALLEDSPPPPCKRGSTEMEGEDEERALKKPKTEQHSSTKIEPGLLIDLTIPVDARKEEEGVILDTTRDDGQINVILPTRQRVIEHGDKSITDLTVDESTLEKEPKKEWTLDEPFANLLRFADLKGSGSSWDPWCLE